MAHQLRRFADQLIRHAADVHHVVRNQPVAALDQLQGRLALAHSGFPRDEDARAVHVHQHAVARLMWRELPGKIMNQGRGEAGGDHLRPEHRHPGSRRQLRQLRRRIQIPADDHAGQGIAEVFLQNLHTLFRFLPLQIGHLHDADQLGPLPGKVLIHPAELHARAVQVRRPDVQHFPLRRHDTGKMQVPLKLFDGDQAITSLKTSARYRATPSS